MLTFTESRCCASRSYGFVNGLRVSESINHLFLLFSAKTAAFLLSA